MKKFCHLIFPYFYFLFYSFLRQVEKLKKKCCLSFPWSCFIALRDNRLSDLLLWFLQKLQSLLARMRLMMVNFTIKQDLLGQRVIWWWFNIALPEYVVHSRWRNRTTCCYMPCTEKVLTGKHVNAEFIFSPWHNFSSPTTSVYKKPLAVCNSCGMKSNFVWQTRFSWLVLSGWNEFQNKPASLCSFMAASVCLYLCFGSKHAFILSVLCSSPPWYVRTLM